MLLLVVRMAHVCLRAFLAVKEQTYQLAGD
jgi:hypothetical protein